MNCADVRELAAAWALGALEREERAEVERHLAEAGPHECTDAVARALATAAKLAAALPELRPDPGVWRAIEARTGVAAPPSRPRVGTLGWAAAAVAAVALVGLVLGARELQRRREEAVHARAQAELAAGERDRARAELQAMSGAAVLQREALALLDLPGTRIVSLAPQRGQAVRAVALVNLAERRAVIASSSLPPQPGRVYQLWVIRGTAPPQPAGFLQTSPAGAAAGEVDRRLLEGAPPDALAVSLEPAGGSPSPTQVLLVGRVAG